MAVAASVIIDYSKIVLSNETKVVQWTDCKVQSVIVDHSKDHFNYDNSKGHSCEYRDL